MCVPKIVAVLADIVQQRCDECMLWFYVVYIYCQEICIRVLWAPLIE